LGNTYGESVEKEIEIKLAEHERRGIERNADSAKQDREQYGDIARRFVFEKIHNRKLFHVCLLYTEIIMFLGIDNFLLHQTGLYSIHTSDILELL
jgi:hypothetical protein